MKCIIYKIFNLFSDIFCNIHYNFSLEKNIIVTVYLMFIKIYYNRSNVPHISELFTAIFVVLLLIMFLNSFCASPNLSCSF